MWRVMLLLLLVVCLSVIVYVETPSQTTDPQNVWTVYDRQLGGLIKTSKIEAIQSDDFFSITWRRWTQSEAQETVTSRNILVVGLVLIALLECVFRINQFRASRQDRG